MVKGISRRVIVVRAPDPRFEQAIFLLREDALGGEGVSAHQVMEEARQVAAGYIRKNTSKGRWLKRMAVPLSLLAGAGVSSLIWAAALFGGMI